jgi:Tol biopolymer transport system component
MDLFGILLEQHTDDEYSDRHPKYSPDGKYIACRSETENSFDLHTINRYNKIEKDLNAGGISGSHGYPFSWSPDGTQIVLWLLSLK